jgi:hypothetical protein
MFFRKKNPPSIRISSLTREATVLAKEFQSKVPIFQLKKPETTPKLLHPKRKQKKAKIPALTLEKSLLKAKILPKNINSNTTNPILITLYCKHLKSKNFPNQHEKNNPILIYSSLV